MIKFDIVLTRRKYQNTMNNKWTPSTRSSNARIVRFRVKIVISSVYQEIPTPSTFIMDSPHFPSVITTPRLGEPAFPTHTSILRLDVVFLEVPVEKLLINIPLIDAKFPFFVTHNSKNSLKKNINICWLNWP